MRRTLTQKIILGTAACTVVGLCAWGALALYFIPARALRAEVDSWRVANQNFEADALNHASVNKRLDAFAQTTLGRTEETVSADVRTALNEMAAAYGLRQTSVANLSPMGVKNPAATSTAEFKDTWKKSLRDAEDFRAMPATVQGKGTLEQCVSFLAALSAQDWAHRIDSVLLRPQNKDRTNFDLTVGLTTFFMADRGPTGERARLWQRPSPEEAVAWRSIVDKNMFREPPAPVQPVATAQAVVPTAPAAEGPTLADWRVSAVVRGSAGPELWLLNTKTAQKLTLAVGESVLEARFLSGSAGVARITIGSQVFEVALNENLGQRRAVLVETRPAEGAK